MNPDHLRYFLEVARHQHIGKASGIVHISPSAISHGISALERELGRELFVKKGKNIFLTSHGTLLMEKAQRLINELETIKDEIAADDVELQGYYRFAGTHLLCARHLAPAWSAVQRGNPKLIAEMNTLRSSQVVAGIIAGEYDFGLCFNPQAHPNLELELAYEGKLVLTARKRHPIFKSKKIDPKEFSRYPATLPKATQGIDNCETHPIFDKFGIKPRTEFICDSYEVAAERILSSDSWGLLPDWIVSLYPGLASYAPKGWDAPVRITIVHPTHRICTRPLKRLSAELKRGFSRC